MTLAARQDETGGAGEPRLDAKPPLIVVVDDFASAREIYVRVLHSAGFRVEEAANVTEAVEKVLALQPDLIVMDLVMPGTDGWELILRLKTNERTSSTQVVVLTGVPHASGAQLAHQLGCDAYLVKPILPHKLLSVVRDLLQHKQAG